MAQQELHLNEPRYLIQVEGGGTPTITHHSLEHAKHRAAKLAQQTRKRVFIFEPTMAFEPVIESDHEIPVVESTVKQ